MVNPMTIATNGYGINDQIIFVGDKEYDFFLFNPEGLFEPDIEELVAGEIRADWEDESDEWDESDPEGDFEGFINDDKLENSLEQPASILQPIPDSKPIQQSALKLELSINLSIFINGESIFSNQLEVVDQTAI